MKFSSKLIPLLITIGIFIAIYYVNRYSIPTTNQISTSITPTQIPTPTIENLPTPNPNLIDWDQAVDFIRDCQVRSVFQNHDLDVTLIHKDGRELQTKEPKIDEIINEVNKYKSDCGKILIGTE